MRLRHLPVVECLVESAASAVVVFTKMVVPLNFFLSAFGFSLPPTSASIVWSAAVAPNADAGMATQLARTQAPIRKRLERINPPSVRISLEREHGNGSPRPLTNTCPRQGLRSSERSSRTAGTEGSLSPRGRARTGFGPNRGPERAGNR